MDSVFLEYTRHEDFMWGGTCVVHHVIEGNPRSPLSYHLYSYLTVDNTYMTALRASQVGATLTSLTIGP